MDSTGDGRQRPALVEASAVEGSGALLSRQADAYDGAAQRWPVAERNVSAVRPCDRSDDAEPEAGAAGATGSSGAAASEALHRNREHLGGEARPVVGDLEDGITVRRGGFQPDATCAGVGGVCHHVVDETLELMVVHEHDDSATGSFGVDVMHRGQPVEKAEDEVVEVYPAPVQRQCAASLPGEDKQVLGEPAQSLGLPPGALQGARHLGRVILGQQPELELGGEYGDRRTQLVAGIVDERAFPLERHGEPGEHGVERAGQPGELVLAGRDRQSVARVGCGDDRRLVRQGRDGSQRRSGQQPAGERERREHERSGHHEQQREPFLRPVDVTERRPDDEHASTWDGLRRQARLLGESGLRPGHAEDALPGETQLVGAQHGLARRLLSARAAARFGESPRGHDHVAVRPDELGEAVVLQHGEVTRVHRGSEVAHPGAEPVVDGLVEGHHQRRVEQRESHRQGRPGADGEQQRQPAAQRRRRETHVATVEAPAYDLRFRRIARKPRVGCLDVRVLVVEDDAAMRGVLRRALQREGYAVDTVDNGTDALWSIGENTYDAVLLDVMIPRPDGLVVLRRLRDEGCVVPVLLLTARGDVGDRVAGLDGGADDYLTKPFALTELFARLRSLTRRGMPDRPDVVVVGDLTLDPGAHSVRRGEERIDLSAKEFALLTELMRHPGEVLTRRHLIDHVWDFAYDDASNVVDVYIRYLRDKVDRPFGRTSIATIRGIGYRFSNDSC